jgi:glucan phosphoethanolaminetransferase (alkaline phosphatase superfamily)
MSASSQFPSKTSGHVMIALKIIALLVFVALTNPGAWDEVLLLWGRKQFATLIPFLIIWAFTLVALVVVSLHPKFLWRAFWAVLIAASTASGMAYFWISHTQISVFDIFAGWNAAHEAGRAASFYAQETNAALALFFASIAVFIWPTGTHAAQLKGIWKKIGFLPAVPIAMMAGMIFLKNGQFYGTLPNQFAPISMAGLLAGKVAFHQVPERKHVAWPVDANAKKQNLVLLVDESIRADYIDLTPGNRFTPEFAKLADKFVNFGPASSAGNCSNYSNALLRFGASREDISGSVNTNPTLFEYAKTAGYRTVFIDAQARALTLGSDMQNFMTLEERGYIDKFYLMRDEEVVNADEALGKIIAEELKAGKPVFIYANKNGAHFPYDQSYPATSAIFHPTMTEAGVDSQIARIAAYRNGIAWSVDRFMKNLFAETNFDHTTLIYTSDHGQELDPGHLTHCLAEKPDPKMNIVPLMVHTSDPLLLQQFQHGAAILQNQANHFQIAPTLYALMGYAPADIAKHYDESLLLGSKRSSQTTSGDVFAMFGGQVNWNDVDLTKNYLENATTVQRPRVAVGQGG